MNTLSPSNSVQRSVIGSNLLGSVAPGASAAAAAETSSNRTRERALFSLQIYLFMGWVQISPYPCVRFPAFEHASVSLTRRYRSLCGLVSLFELRPSRPQPNKGDIFFFLGGTRFLAARFFARYCSRGRRTCSAACDVLLRQRADSVQRLSGRALLLESFQIFDQPADSRPTFMGGSVRLRSLSSMGVPRRQRFNEDRGPIGRRRHVVARS